MADIIITDEDIEILLAQVASALSVSALSQADLFMLLVIESPVAIEALRETMAITANASFDPIFEAMKRAISVPGADAFSQALAMANDQARINAKTLAVNLTASELERVSITIAKGLEEGLDPLAIARRLDAVKGLDPQRAAKFEKTVEYFKTLGLSDEELKRRSDRLFDKLLLDRKETIARTEARRATGQARRIDAEAGGADTKSWITAGDARVDAECIANESQGPIPIKDEFDSGHQTEPLHPRCRCAVVYGTGQAQKDRMAQFAADRAQATAASAA